MSFRIILVLLAVTFGGCTHSAPPKSSVEVESQFTMHSFENDVVALICSNGHYEVLGQVGASRLFQFDLNPDLSDCGVLHCVEGEVACPFTSIEDLRLARKVDVWFPHVTWSGEQAELIVYDRDDGTKIDDFRTQVWRINGGEEWVVISHDMYFSVAYQRSQGYPRIGLVSARFY